MKNTQGGVTTTSVKLFAPGNVTISEHKIKSSEVGILKSQEGVYQVSKNYSQIVDGHGTGLRPPTSDEWNAISQDAYAIDNVSSLSATPSTVDNSISPYFPPIGNQGGQGSCVAWSIGYYITTYNAAKANGWNFTGASWSGGQPTVSYQNKIISPAFVYNLINEGTDGGSYFSDAINLVCSIGASTWATMPYNQNDYVSWPSQAAWSEAPLYRGGSTSYQYLIFNDANGISNLKNLLASGNLVTIAVDSTKFKSLTSNDLWALDNYNSPQTDHAGTVVGYDDNFSYVESGQVRYGAFKVVNSWGIGNWEPLQTGYYWVSYATMQQRVVSCYYYNPQTNYQPDLFATFKIDDNSRGNLLITVGLGNPSNPITTKKFSSLVFGGNQSFCPNNIVLDISEFSRYVPTLNNQQFYLQVYDTGTYSIANGTIQYFAIGNYSASGTPCPAVKGQNVFLNVTYNPNASNITLLQAGASSPLSSSNYFAVSYYVEGQAKIAQAVNGTLTFIVDVGTNIVLSGPSSGSNSSEQWVLNSQNGPVTIPSGSNATFYYYDLLNQQISYSVTGGGTTINPLLSYYAAPSVASSQFIQNYTSTALSSNQQTIMVLRGTTVSGSNNILYIVPPALTAQAQWAAPISSWSVSQPNQVPNPIIYYFQYQINATYAASDGSVVSPSPILSGTQFGSIVHLLLVNSNQTIWLDANSTWTTNTTLTAPSGTEQWICSNATSGVIAGATAINSTYIHQYYLTINSTYGSPSGQGWYNAGSVANFAIASPLSGGTGVQYIFVSWAGSGSGSYSGNNTSGICQMNSAIIESASWHTQCYLTIISNYGSPVGSGWYDSGATATFSAATPLSGGVGTQYILDSWNGSGIGSYSGSAGSYSLNMSGPITELASWITQFYLTVNNGGYGTVTGSGWYINGTFAQAVVLSNVVSGGVGVQNVFSGWTGDASDIGSTSNSIIVNSPKTVTANWTTQFQIAFAVTPSGSASITPASTNLWVNSGPLLINAMPHAGYRFMQWTADSGSIAFDNSGAMSATAAVNGPGIITANLSPNPTPTPIPSPTPTTTPMLTEAPTLSPTPFASALPTSLLLPTQQPEPASSTPMIYYTIIIVVMASVTVALLATIVFLSHRK